MPMKSKALAAAFDKELESAKDDVRARRYDDGMRHLERAHVLGQTFFREHMRVHGWMLRVALERVDVIGALGQIARIVLGAIGTPLGRLPIGNTGSSDVPMFQRMAIPADLARLIDGDRHE